MTVASTTKLNGYTYAVHKPEPASTPNVCQKCMKLINVGDMLTRLEVVDQSCRENRFPKFHENCFGEKEDVPDLSHFNPFRGEWKLQTYGKGHHWVVDPQNMLFQQFSVKEMAEGFVNTINNLDEKQAAALKSFLG